MHEYFYLNNDFCLCLFIALASAAFFILFSVDN